MVDRQWVFEQKVLKKLYSPPLPPEGRIQEAPTKISSAKQEQKEEERNKITDDSIGDAQIIPVCSKVYTVSLPPPGSEVCSTRSNEQHESQDSSGEEPEASKKKYLIENVYSTANNDTWILQTVADSIC
ncbi:uncharacterized protein LOC121278026 isoform X2 [Carcharodon carcharias]|uniref:uncharacterized protein LOC121278026 isoform X2 n=1 Tax=Carcharodon carcharias TaxID=13397 RepID=UPI001B7ECB03|nr:uncharacterized protein LOC121278026 isoform X2 [Carcharodon carcharias]